MLIQIPRVLNPEQVLHAQELLQQAQWTDGSVTAGYQSAKAKHNLQLPEDSPAAKELGKMILDALAGNGLFVSAALPSRIFPPLFNCYQEGGSFGVHVDNAIRYIRGTSLKLRTDVSMTLFLSDPESYEGGELIIEDTFGSQSVKLPAGDMILYPGTSLHRVTPVTRGRRLASFSWLQSMVASDEQRRLLFELDSTIQQLNNKLQEEDETVRLTNIYHNLLRQWAQPD